MTDKELVDWLRNCSIYEGRAFLRQSADRIEELGRHLTLSGKVGKALSERIEALEAENERLREALTDIGVYGCGMLNQPAALNGPEEAWLRLRIREMENVARAALGEKP